MSSTADTRHVNRAPTGATNGRFFVGRQDTLTSLKSTLNESVGCVQQVYGAPGIGKTTLLQKVYETWLAAGKPVVMVEANDISAHSISTLLQALLTTVSNHLSIENHSQNDETAAAEFAASPYRTFVTQLNDLLQQSGRSPCLLIVDDLDKMWQKAADDEQLAEFLKYVNKALPQNGHFSLLVSTQSALGEGTYPQLRLPPFTHSETRRFIQNTLRFIVVDEVVDYIHFTTAGDPAALHHLCQETLNQHRLSKFKQLTLADISAIRNKHPANIRHGQPLASYHDEKRAATTQIVSKRVPFSARQKQITGALSALVLLMFAFIAVRQLAGRSSPSETATPQLAILPDTETATAVSPTATTLPTVTPTTPPTETAAPILPPPDASPTPAATQTTEPTPSASPTRRPLINPQIITRTIDNMPMRLIPAGTFLMGSSEGEAFSAIDEVPQREVSMSQFYIDIYEVSVGQYASFLNRLGTHQSSCNFFDCTLPRAVIGYTSYLEEEEMADGSSRYTPVAGFDDYPMNHVSWYGAFAYCQAMGARLPTEAEWEYAARGSDGRLFPWGNEPPDQTLAVFNSISFDELKPVDALPDGASPFGLFNMAGSVWEWTADWYSDSYYRTAPNIDPPGPETGETRVARGGAWPFNNQAERLRTANRNDFEPEFISSTVGFRCANTP